MEALQSTKHLVHLPRKDVKAYHINFDFGQVMVNFFRHERFEKHLSWSADLIPYNDHATDLKTIEGKKTLLRFINGKLMLEKKAGQEIPPYVHSDHINTGKAESSVLIRAGVRDVSGKAVWLDNNKNTSNKLEYKPFFNNTEAAEHKWLHSNKYQAEFQTFRTWPSGMATYVKFAKAPEKWQFYLELGKSYIGIEGIPYCVKYDEKNGLIIVSAPEQKLYFVVGIDKKPQQVECGYGDNIPSKTFLSNAKLSGVQSVDFKNIKDGETLSAGGMIFEFSGPCEFGIYLACRETENESKNVVNKMREIGIKNIYKEHLNYWKEIHGNIISTTDELISEKFIHQQVSHIISAFTIRHEDSDKMAMIGPPYYYDYGNTRDESVLIRVFNSIGLSGIARKILNEWQTRYVDRKHPETTPLSYLFWYDYSPVPTQTVEVCCIRIESIHHHWFLTADTKWLSEKGYTLAKLFADAIAERIDSKTGLVCAETEGDYHNFEGSFMFLVQTMAYLAFKLMGEMAEGQNKLDEANYWKQLSYNLKQSVLNNYPTDADNVFWFNINPARKKYEKRVTGDTVGYLVLSGILPPGDIRLSANVASLDYLRFQLAKGIFFYFYVSNHWYDPACMLVQQGFPIGTLYARMGRADRTKEILKLHHYVVEKDRYKVCIERPYIEDLVLNTGIHGEAMRYLYEDQPYWKDAQPGHLTGPLQWAAAGPMYMLSTECFCILPSEDRKKIEYFHFNPVIAPYKIVGNGIKAYATKNEVRCNGKRILHTDNPLGRIEVSYKLKKIKLFTRKEPVRMWLWLGDFTKFRCNISLWRIGEENKTVILDIPPFTEASGSWM